MIREALKAFFLFLGLLLAYNEAAAISGKDYFSRFMAYSNWNNQLPSPPTPEFISFISENSPLANKLRDKWLYLLASQKNWEMLNKYYQPTNDYNLQCFYYRANYYIGKQDFALAAAESLWLKGENLPVACDVLFKLLVTSDHFNEQLISRRIALALDKQNLSLAREMLRIYKKPRIKDDNLLAKIARKPELINQIGAGELHGDFYLYGLKRLVVSNMEMAVRYWKQNKSRKLLTHAQQQSFLAYLALYKAMRNQDDTELWFGKVQPAWYNDALVDWQIRYAIKRNKWQQVERLINLSNEKDSPCWQYWLARSYEAREDNESAQALYKIVAKNRNYYGFMASLRLHSKPHFENEHVNNSFNRLKIYQPIINNIKSLYNSNQPAQASRLLNDFALELPKEDKPALISWLSEKLQWHGKSVYLSNHPDLINQLALRFPLAYVKTISTYSKNYHIPKEFIYAIIRQESAFRDDVVSPAGARGLMQVMPATANLVAKQEKIVYRDKAQLFLSQKNIHIGVAYLRQLGKRFNQHPLLIAAAYNAGPRQVVHWQKDQNVMEVDMWIETLPWRETRNYLKNIIAFYTVYQYRLNQKPDLGAFMKPIQG